MKMTPASAIPETDTPGYPAPRKRPVTSRTTTVSPRTASARTRLTRLTKLRTLMARMTATS